MDLELPQTAVEFGVSAERAFTHAGGVDLARRAEAAPEIRTEVVGPLLERLGARDLPVGDELEAALAAGELCRVAGRCALPYPLASVLVRGDGPPTALVDPSLPRTDHGDLFERWLLAGVEGGLWEGRPRGRTFGTELGPFVVDMAMAPEPSVAASDLPVVPLLLTLTSWQALGTLDAALELAIDHVNARHQFGRPLAHFQAVQFQVADATVAVQSLRELARFTMWRLWAAPLDRVVDALALRAQTLESAHGVLRTCHQLHGALGFCDEHDLSVLSRHVQPLLRLWAGLEATTEHLIAAIGDTGFDSLFDQGASTRGT